MEVDPSEASGDRLCCRRAAARAEAGAGAECSPAGRACEVGPRNGWLVSEGAAGANLAAYIVCLHGVIGTDAPRHEESLDEAKDCRDAGPAEKKIENAETIAAKVEVMESEGAEKDSQEDSDDLVASCLLVLGIEPRALVLRHSCGVEGIGIVQILHTSDADEDTLESIRGFRGSTSCGGVAIQSLQFSGIFET
jgi:hypothetical protein